MDRQSCCKVIFSSKAHVVIASETFERFSTETGGIFLGKIIDDIWYVIECIDAGPKSVFQPAYFEYDTEYVNHLSNKIARYYDAKLELLGLWHRHPGSFDSFSRTDDRTNSTYASMFERGAISALVNLDPDFRLTVYHALMPLQYKPVPYEQGDKLIPNELLQLKDVKQIITSRSSGKKGLSRKHTKSLFDKAYSLTNRIFKPSHPEPSSPNEAETSSFEDEQLFQMLEAEMEYIETQSDYEVTISRKPGQIYLALTYVQNIPSFPSRVNCSLEHRGDDRFFVVDGERRSYSPGIVEKYINERIREAETKFGATKEGKKS